MAREITILSTKDSIVDFKESLVWKDIVNELEAWKKGFEYERAAMVDDAATENPSTAAYLLHSGDVNGRIKAVEYMLQIPDIFIQMLEEKENDDRTES